MADYATVDSKSLGSYSTFQPSDENKIDVVFQPDLSNGYYSVLALNRMGGDGIGYDLSNDLSNNDNIDYDISGQDQIQEKPLYSFGSNPINGFFIGSVTILGLFVLYRLLQK
jgi:hypothetical protein